MDWGRLIFLCATLIVLLGMAAYAARARARRYAPLRDRTQVTLSAAFAASPVLTNEDIARMGRARIEAILINKLVRRLPHRFQIDSESLVALKKDGVPDDVMMAIVEVTLEYPGPPENPRPPALEPTESVVRVSDVAKLTLPH